MLEFIYTFYHNSIVFSVIERYSDNSQEIIISQSERVFLVFIPPMPKTFSFRAITCPSILFKKLFPNMNVHNIILTNFAQALPINNFQVVRIIYIERIFAVAILFHSLELNVFSIFSSACATIKIIADSFINVATYLIEETAIAFFFLGLNHLQDDF